MIEKVIAKMIAHSNGNKHDVAHFMKVYAYAQTIGKMEGLDTKTQQILELAAVVHDIACPLCREKYGSAKGSYQEAESEALLRPFFEEFSLPTDVLERIVYLVTHHHTYDPVDGIDHRILLEADFLVNGDESNCSKETIEKFRDNVYRTKSGLQLLKDIYQI